LGNSERGTTDYTWKER